MTAAAAAATAASELRALLIADPSPPKQRILDLATQILADRPAHDQQLHQHSSLFARSPHYAHNGIRPDPLTTLASLIHSIVFDHPDPAPPEHGDPHDDLKLLLQLATLITDHAGIAPAPLRIFLRTLHALLNNALGQALLSTAGSPPKPRSNITGGGGARSASSTAATRRAKSATNTPRKLSLAASAPAPITPLALTAAPDRTHLTAPDALPSSGTAPRRSSSANFTTAPALQQQQHRRKLAYQRAQLLSRFLVHCSRDTRPITSPAPSAHWIRGSPQAIANDLLSSGRLPRATHLRLEGGGGGGSGSSDEQVLVTGPLAAPWEAIDPVTGLRLPPSAPGAGVGFTIVLTFRLDDLLTTKPDQPYTEVVNLCQIDDIAGSSYSGAAAAGAGISGPPLVGLALSIIRRPAAPGTASAAAAAGDAETAPTLMQLHYTTTSFAFAQPSARSGKMPPGATTTVVFGIGGGVTSAGESYPAAGPTTNPAGPAAANSSRPLVLRSDRTYSLMLAHAAPPLASSTSSSSSSSSSSAAHQGGGATARLPSLDIRTPVSLYIDGELVDVRRSVWPRVRPLSSSSSAAGGGGEGGGGVLHGMVRAEFGGTPAVSPLPPRPGAGQSTAGSGPEPSRSRSGSSSLGAVSPLAERAPPASSPGGMMPASPATADTPITPQNAVPSSSSSSAPTWALRLYSPLYILRTHLPTSPLPSVGAGPDTPFLAHQLLLPSGYTAHGHAHEPVPAGWYGQLPGSGSGSGAGSGGGGASPSSAGGGGAGGGSHSSSTGLGRFLTYAGSMRVNLRLDERSLPLTLPLSVSGGPQAGGGGSGTTRANSEEALRHAELMAEHALRERRRRLVRAVAGSGADSAASSARGSGGLDTDSASPSPSSSSSSFPSPSMALALVAGKARERTLSFNRGDRGAAGGGQLKSAMEARDALDFWGERKYGMYLSLDFGTVLWTKSGGVAGPTSVEEGVQLGDGQWVGPGLRNRARKSRAGAGAGPALFGAPTSMQEWDAYVVRRPGESSADAFPAEQPLAAEGEQTSWREYTALSDAAHVLGAVPALLELLRLASWAESGTRETSGKGADSTAKQTTSEPRPTSDNEPPSSSTFVHILELILLVIGGETGWRTSEEAERTGVWEVLKLVLERNARLLMPAKALAAEVGAAAGGAHTNADRVRGWAADERCAAAVMRVLFEAVGRRYVRVKAGSEGEASLTLASSAGRPPAAAADDDDDAAVIKPDDSNWALVNPLLYRLILLDMRVFRHCSPELRREHLAHFDALLRASSLRGFNLRRIHRMGVLRRVLSAWNARVFESGAVDPPLSVGGPGLVGSAVGRASNATALTDDVLLAVRTLLKAQFSDTTVRILTSYLATHVGRPLPPKETKKNLYPSALAPAVAEPTRPSSPALTLATLLMIMISELARERAPLLDKLSFAADIRWLVPLFASWNAPADSGKALLGGGDDGRRIVSLSSMQSGLTLHGVAGTLQTSPSTANRGPGAEALAVTPSLPVEERREIVKATFQLFVALCALDNNRRQRPTGRQEGPTPSQRNYSDRFNGSGGFRVLERYLPLHWNAPTTLPLCWAMLFGLSQVPILSASGVVVAVGSEPTSDRTPDSAPPSTQSGFVVPRLPQSTLRPSSEPDVVLLDNFGPSRYVLVKNPRALRLIVACWRQGLLELGRKEDAKRKYSDLLASGSTAASPGSPVQKRPQHLRKRSRSVNFDAREVVGDSDQRLLDATLTLLEQHCDREALRDEFREMLFTPNVLRGIIEAIVPSARSLGADTSAFVMPGSATHLASRMLGLLARLATESMAATGSMAIVDALLSAVPPMDLTQQSAFRSTLLDAVMRNVARASAVDVATGKPVLGSVLPGIGALYAFVAFIARSSEEYLSGLSISVPTVLNLLSGLFQQLREEERTSTDIVSAVKKHTRLRTLLLTSFNRIFLCQLANTTETIQTLRNILQYQEWLLGPENNDDAFVECVLNRTYYQLRHGDSAEEKQVAFEVLCAFTLARPPVAEAALLPGKTAADVLQSHPDTVFDLLSISLDGDESTELPYEDAWSAFIKSNEALRAAAHLDRVARVKQLMDRSDWRQRSVQNTEYKLRSWHAKLCENETAKIARSEQDAREISRFASKQQQEMFIDLQQQNSILLVDGLHTHDMTLDSTEGPRRMRKKLRPLRSAGEDDQETTVAQGHHSRGGSGSVVEDDELSPFTHSITLPTAEGTKLKDADIDDEVENNDDTEAAEAPLPDEDEDDDKFRRVLRALDRGDIIEDVFNASRVVSIECRGTLTIIGRSNLYLLDDYFQRPNGELVDAWDAPAEERDAFVLATLTSNVEQRSLLISQLDGEARTRKWSWHDVDACFRRTWLHRKTALELFFRDGQSCLLVLPSTDLLNRLHSEIRARAPRAIQAAEAAMNSVCDVALPSPGPSNFKSRLADAAANALRGRGQASGALTQAWLERRISNFEYLMGLNSLSGRTYNDCTQYPVMPWVVADYSSDELDLNKASTFRDLSLPMGAQTPNRRAEVEERYQQLLEMAEDGDAAFHYGTHYSTAAVVCAYLVRVRPFDRVLVALQGGTFDLADRTFSSIAKAWASASELSRGDVRELTPEFYYLPELLVNTNRFDFGTTQAGQLIDDVELPPWAKGNPLTFIKLHREALESEYVSAHLHLWIDLIFGWRSRGIGAVEATNCFHPLSYESGINLETIESTLERQAAAQAIHNFGQTPQQLFNRPHPARGPLQDPNQSLNLNIEDQPWLLIEHFAPLHEVHSRITTISYTHNGPQGFGLQSASLNGGSAQVSVHPTDDSVLISPLPGSLAPGALWLPTTVEHVASSPITCLASAGQNEFIVASTDGLLTVCSVHPRNGQVSMKGILRGHTTVVKSIFVSSAWSLIITGSADGTAMIWDLNRLEHIRTLPPHSGHVDHVAIDDHHGYLATVTGTADGSEVRLWTINGDLLAEHLIAAAHLGKVSSVAFLNADLHSSGRLTVLLTGHEGKVASWECVQDTQLPQAADVAPSLQLQWKLRQHYVFEHRDRYGSDRTKQPITAISATSTRMLTGDARGRLFQWSMPASGDHSSANLNTEALLGGCCAECDKRFGVLEARRTCTGCAATFCSACAAVEGLGAFKGHRFCSNCKSILRTLPLGV